MNPIVEELRDLQNRGILWRPNDGIEVTSRFITTIFTADSVARPDVLRMKRFNGLHEFTFCLATEQMEQNVWVYPARQYEMRTNETLRNDITEANREREIVNGVKGVPSLSILPDFDMVDDVTVDSSHNVFLGMAKRLMVRHMNDSEEKWYIGSPQQTSAIDEI